MVMPLIKVNVKSEAEKIVTALKDHPALFAWDLLNEPLWTVDNYCIGVDHASVIKAVDAMHDLVRSIDSRTPLTVGEGKDEYLGEWNTITNFASPHIYGIRYDTAHAGVDFQNRIGNLVLWCPIRRAKPIGSPIFRICTG
jgi:endo-1,4-beta-mannosidase